MMATRILDGLERLDVSGEEASAAARLAFLEWVFAHPGEATAQDARAALDALANETPVTDAGQAFLCCLQQASVPMLRSRSRSERAARVH